MRKCGFDLANGVITMWQSFEVLRWVLKFQESANLEGMKSCAENHVCVYGSVKLLIW